MKTLKVAAVGAGYFSHYHFDGWRRIPEARLVAVVDRSRYKAETAARQYGIPRTYENLTDMLAAEKPDVVDIITPPDTHWELLRQVADRGIDIICQKPLAPSLQEARRMVLYAADKGVRLLVHENWRFQPWYRQLKKMIDQKKIGDQVFSLYWRMRMGDGWADDAYQARQPYFRTMPQLLIYETGIHFIDSFRYLLGEVNSVYARLRRYNQHIVGEDAALVQMEFKNGAVAILDANRYNECNREDPRFTFGEAVVDGNKGTLRLYTDGKITLQPLGKPEEKVDYPLSRKGFAGDCVFALQQHLIKSLVDQVPAETEGRAYLRNLEIQQAIYESSIGQKVWKVD